MWEAALNGYISGFVMSLMLGTVFFALIQHSVDYGFKTGIYIALGVVCSDIMFVSIAVSGASLIPAIEEYQNTIRVVGAIVLLLLGASSWVQSAPVIKYPETRMGSVVYFFTKGFLLNVLNPVNFFAWVSITTYLRGALHYTIGTQVIYFVFCLLAIFVTEAMIALGASKLRNIVTARFVSGVNKVAGSVFIIAALVLLWQAFIK